MSGVCSSPPHAQAPRLLRCRAYPDRYTLPHCLQATACLFTERKHPNPSSALAFAKDLGFDFATLKKVRAPTGR